MPNPHHLLASLVLEIDVDVRRFVALLRNEALEQHREPRRIDLGDAERVAHGRIRCGAAALAQDVARARVRDDVLDGKEVRLVAELGDQRELVIDQLAHFGRRGVNRAVAAREARLGEPAQVRRRRGACRHDLFRIFVAELVQREHAALRDGDRLREQRRRV